MNKIILEKFINKYNLSGAVESVTWQADAGTVSVSFASDDRALIGFLSTQAFCLESGKYDIFETVQLRNLLGVVSDEIDVLVEKVDDVPSAFVFKDKTTKVRFVLAESSVIPITPSLKSIPEPEVSIKLDQVFMSKYIRAVSALKDVDTFTVVSDGSIARVVIGYSQDLNQSSVSIEVETELNALLAPIHFSARYLKDTLLANKEMSGGILNISSKGLAHLRCVVDNFKVEYYLLKCDN